MICAVLLAAVTAVFVWRLSTSPLDMAFAKPYIEKQLNDQSPNFSVSIEQIILHWPDFKGPLLLGLKDTKISDQSGKTIMAVEEAGIGFSLPYLLIGKIRPTSLALMRPEIDIIRNEDGRFEIGIDTDASDVDEQEMQDQQTTIVSQVLGYVASPGQDNVQSPLRALKSFEIQKARLNFEDLLFDTHWSIPEVSADFVSTRTGMKADFHAQLETGTATQSGSKILAQMEMPWETRQSQVKIKISNFDLAYLGNKFPSLEFLQGQNVKFDIAAHGQLDENLSPQALSLDITSRQGAFSYADYIKDTVSYSDLVLQAVYTAQTGQADIKTFAVNLNGVSLNATASAIKQPETDDAYQIRADFSIPALQPEQIGALWPQNLTDEGAYEWLVEKLANGTFDNLTMGMDAVLRKETAADAVQVLDDNAPEESALNATGIDTAVAEILSENLDPEAAPPSENELAEAADTPLAEPKTGYVFDLKDIVADFGFTGMSIDYRSPLPPVQKAKGKGWFKYNSELLYIDVEQASAGNMTVEQGKVELSHFIEGGKGHADVNVTLSGDLAHVFAILEKEPIGLDHGYDLKRMSGQADLNINLGIPTYGDVLISDVQVSVMGKVANGTIPAIIEQTDLNAISADILVKTNDLTIKGNGSFAGQPLDFTYAGFLDSTGKSYKEKIDITGTATDSVREGLGVDLSFMLTGPAYADATYINYGGRQTVDVRANLVASLLDIEPFAYHKPAGQEAKADFQIIIDNKSVREISALNVTAPNLLVENGNLSFRQIGAAAELAGGRSSNARIGETHGNVEFEVLSGGVYKINANLGVLDARPFLDNDKKQEIGTEQEPQTPMIVILSAQRMLTHENRSVTNTKLYIDIDNKSRFNQFEMDAVAGDGVVYLRYKPDDAGQRNFRFEADDAGATLKAFGLYEEIRGGRIVIHAEPMGDVSDRNLIGRAEITNFEVYGAPALARILSLMSLDGLANGLTSSGLQFTRLESNFDWLYRPQGSLIVLQDGRTSGNAVGLTFDGTFDQALGTMDISGTIAPVSYLNRAIGAIPLLGEILTGGSGIFAATYSAKGESKDPKISVNPLSVLAPGIIRKILFEQN